jgi:hypothetical protein
MEAMLKTLSTLQRKESPERFKSLEDAEVLLPLSKCVELITIVLRRLSKDQVT